MIGIEGPLSSWSLVPRLWIAAVWLICFAGAATAAESARVENARRAFSILDMNGDKKVSYPEFANRKIDAFSAPDRNEDNVLSEDEVLISPERFVEVDRNGDGKVSGVEFIDSRYGQFEPYDANKDGMVDLAEFTQVLAGK